jgi:hypothetical protein
MRCRVNGVTLVTCCVCFALPQARPCRPLCVTHNTGQAPGRRWHSIRTSIADEVPMSRCNARINDTGAGKSRYTGSYHSHTELVTWLRPCMPSARPTRAACAAWGWPDPSLTRLSHRVCMTGQLEAALTVICHLTRSQQSAALQQQPYTCWLVPSSSCHPPCSHRYMPAQHAPPAAVTSHPQDTGVAARPGHRYHGHRYHGHTAPAAPHHLPADLPN